MLLWDCKDDCSGTSEDPKYEVNEQSAVTKVPIAATDPIDSGHVAPNDKGIEFYINTTSDLYILWFNETTHFPENPSLVRTQGSMQEIHVDLSNSGE
jgi:hypothetical protein